jgi:hypothetical protein
MKGERNEEKSSPDFQNSMCNGPVVGGSMCKECVCKREREREREVNLRLKYVSLHPL